MTVGILGLGLIGGSLARAYAKSGHTVIAFDADAGILEFAQIAGAVHSVLDANTVTSCDLILLSIFADGSVNWLEANAAYIRTDALVIDCCGIKLPVCQRCFPLAEQYGFTFVGGHPMAGSHFSGFKYSRSNLFQGAPMVLIPPRYDDPELLERVKNVLSPCRFGSFSVTTAEEHDKIIAFTSQMAHLVSNAYIKSPTALTHKGFSAGSYKDMTRVAWLNPQMWADLFLANRENMLFELDTYIENLQAYRTAIIDCDESRLVALLQEGKLRKEEVDG